MFEFDAQAIKDGCVIWFFDVDGTLLHRAVEFGSFDDRVSTSVAEAIREFVAAGNVAMLSTGRDPDNINQSLAELPFAGAVFLGGAYVRVGDEILLDGTFDDELALTVMRECEECGAAAAFTGSGGTLVFSPTQEGTWASPVTYTTINDLLASAPKEYCTHKVNFIGPADYERWRSHTSVADEFMALDAGGGAWEIVLKGISKAEGARAAIAGLGVAPSLSVAIGDSANDVGLFKACQISFAMGDSEPDVIAEATHVTGDVDHDGAAAALRELETYWKREARR